MGEQGDKEKPEATHEQSTGKQGDKEKPKPTNAQKRGDQGGKATNEQNAKKTGKEPSNERKRKNESDDDSDNVQKKKKKRGTVTNSSKVASKLVNKAKAKVKGSWHYVNKEIAERLKETKCFLCGEQKRTLQNLDKHVRSKHKAFRYKCRYCKKKNVTRAGRNKHLMYHTVGYRYPCEDCSKSFLF